jgi:hypothetical protein
MAVVLTPGARRAGWVMLWILVAAVLAALVVPLRVLRPFAPQTPGGVALAFWLRRMAPAAAWVALAAALLMAWLLWPGARRAGRVALAGALLLLAALVPLTRVNPFERMFSPLPERAWAAPAAADFVAPGDMVLAVAVGGEAAAYPVRQLAYHHVVMDTVGGRPVAVTY